MYLYNVLFSQFSAPGSVTDTVIGVFNRQRPIQVMRIDAALATFSASVRGLVLIARRRSVGVLAGETVGASVLAFVPDDAVAVLVSLERPLETFIAGVGQDNILKEPLSASPFGIAAERIAVPLPCCVMHPAQASGARSLIAAGNGAFAVSGFFARWAAA